MVLRTLDAVPLVELPLPATVPVDRELPLPVDPLEEEIVKAPAGDISPVIAKTSNNEII